MIQVLKNIYSHLKASAPSDLITIGDKVFVVAHSPKEMAAAMKTRNIKFSGYIFSPQSLSELQRQLAPTKMAS